MNVRAKNTDTAYMQTDECVFNFYLYTVYVFFYSYTRTLWCCSQLTQNGIDLESFDKFIGNNSCLFV